MAAVEEHADALYIAAPTERHAMLDLPVTCASRIALRKDDTGKLQLHPDLTPTALPLLLAAQADKHPALSRVRAAPSTLLRSESISVDPKRTLLRVYLQRLAGDVDGAGVAVSFEDGSRGAPKAVLEVERSHGAAVFNVELAGVPQKKMEKGMRISPVIAGKPGTGLIWTAELGLDVVLAESFSELLSPAQTDLSVMYHRFGDFDDWHDWELHVWTDASDEYPAYSTMVEPECPVVPGGARFDLAGLLFPSGAIVRAEPVRMSMFPGRVLMNEYGEEYQGDPYRDASRRDVVREWVSGRAPARVMHFLQGEREVLLDPPVGAEMRCVRRFRLRYRRYVANDYDDWDLWTWDPIDRDCNRIAVAPEPDSLTRAWVDFVIDRADYGGGASISFVPRKGGDAWKERDEPTRVWKKDVMSIASTGLEVAIAPDAAPSNLRPVLAGRVDSSLRMFIILQGSGLILRKLDDARSMMKAFVDSEESIMVKAPVPVSWISPPKRGRPAVSNTSVKVRESVANGISSMACDRRNVAGSILRFRKVRQISETESRLVFDEKAVKFEEDFLVENVIVTVPGFDTVTLTWGMHEDWDKYLYKGSLGWEYEATRCSFRCFAPTADQVYVVLYNSASGKEGRRVVPMRRIPDGCWKAIVIGNLKGKYYNLLAEGENKRLFPGVEVIDPYSRCNTGHTGRGLIFGFEDTNIHPRPDISPQETLVCELHIRDVTIDENSGISKRGKFMGLTERGTTMKPLPGTLEVKALNPWNQEPIPGMEKGMQTLNKLSTGLDHIVQMGINTIQILPIQDFDNDESDESSYGWGYMPVHFNSPDGWYASSTTSVARVTEFKELVDAIHRAGLKVIMDVVYNHTSEDSNEYNLDARFSFNGLAPRYYYRTCGNTPVAHTGDSTCGMRRPDEPRCGACYSNGSGCGNEFRSESPMGRKFIIDSLKYWVTEYKIDGFRFDLLGLIDVDTLESAASELRMIDSRIMIYGEPWAGGLSPIRITEKGMQRSKGFGVFNNTFRDAIRGSPFGAEETFVMDGGRLTEVKGGIVGSVDDFCDFPLETINYVECHDNYTLWDHMRFYIRSRTDDIIFTENDMRRMNRLAAVIVFTSQGVPFMQVGQEMCRTKFDVENSYESSDKINKVRWERKQWEWTTVQYYRGLILLRRTHPEIFCKETADDVHESLIFYEDLGLPVPERCIAYRVLGNTAKLLERLRSDNPNVDQELLQEESLQWTTVVVLLNPTPSEIVFELPDKESDAIWMEVVDATNAGTRSLRSAMIGSIAVQGRSASVLRRSSKKEEIDSQLMRRLAAVSDSYCSFHGDDPLTRYAVGLSREMNADELEEHTRLQALRKQFEKQRVRRGDEDTFVPSSKMTEANAIEAVDLKHGEHHEETKSSSLSRASAS